MSSLNHTHTYVKYKKRPGYMRCAHPDCTHFIEKEIACGKRSCCNNCGKAFILSSEDIKLAKPRCLLCANTRKAHAYQAGIEATKNIINFFPGGGVGDE